MISEMVKKVVREVLFGRELVAGKETGSDQASEPFMHNIWESGIFDGLR